MKTINFHLTMNKQVRRQWAYAYIFLLPFVLFALSGFTFPNTSQTPDMAAGTTLPLTLQMSALHPGYAVDDGCSDIITLEQFSWSEIRIYFNACALEHFTAIVAGASAAGAGAGAFGLVSLLCQECAPLVPWITAIVSGATAGIDFLQYASQGCGGAFLIISWDGGIRFEPACGIQARRS